MKTTFLRSRISICKTASVLSLLLYAITPSLLRAQTSDEAALKSKYNSYTQKAAQEKVFVHIDRETYVAGETLWFKIYIVDAQELKPLDLSKVAYLEILGKDNSAILQTKVSVEKGIGKGSLTIPTSVQSGAYKVRCYTTWMKNFSADYYFETPVFLYNSFIRPDYTSETARTNTLDIQFFPEGGNLVPGVENTIGFRGIGSNGYGQQFVGALVDSRGDTISKFEPARFGIGRFSFTPKANEQYKALVFRQGYSPVSVVLPTANAGSWGIRLSKAENLQVTIHAADRYNGLAYLLYHTGGGKAVVERVQLTNGIATASVQERLLSEGITHFTVFNLDQKPVAERLWFKRPTNALRLEILTEKELFGPKESVPVQIAANTGKSPVNGSVSVYRIDSLPTAPQALADSYLLLSSDLSGTVESPEYYFRNTDPATDLALDNLMITHGWRKFKWSDVLNDQETEFPFIPEYGGHFITGKIVDKYSGKPVSNVPVFLGSPGKEIQLFVDESDKNGNLRFETRNFFGPREVLVTANSRIDSTYKITIDNPFSERFSARHLPELPLSEAWQDQLLQRSISMQTTVGYAPKEQTPPQAAVPTFFGKPDESYNLDDFTRFPTMEEVLREYIPGVSVRKRKGGYMLRVSENKKPFRIFEQDPLIMFDGIPVFDTDRIIAFDPIKVKRIEVVDAEYYLGPLLFQGIVSFTTYKNDMAGFEPDTLSLVLPYNGLQVPREFYAPKYDSRADQASRIPDFRNLLYWNPDINLTDSGKAQTRFYTSEQPGTYKIVVQGISADGRPGSTVKYIKVGAPLN